MLATPLSINATPPLKAMNTNSSTEHVDAFINNVSTNEHLTYDYYTNNPVTNDPVQLKTSPALECLRFSKLAVQTAS